MQGGHDLTKIQSIRLLVSTSSAFLAIAPVVATAEETPKAAAAEHDGRADILVVAEKRSAKLQDVPIQVSVLTGDALAARQITQTQDIAGTIPNMSVERNDTYRNTAIVIRSISQINNADSPVAVIVDGVPQNDQKQFGMRLFDIAQIEVLKGPQGSLYGRNAEGGAIIITTTAPTTSCRASPTSPMAAARC